MIIANSIQGRLVQLERAFQMITSDLPADTLRVSDDLAQDIMETLENLRTANGTLKEQLADRREQGRRRRETIANLSEVVRQYWSVLRKMVARQKLPINTFALYNLPLYVNPPGPYRSNDWLQFARNIAEGEVAAVGQGIPAMANPSLEEVQAALAEADVASVAADAAEVHLKDAQSRVREASERASFQLYKLADWLRYSLRGNKPSVRRDIMRSFGYRFPGGTGNPTAPPAGGEPESAEAGGEPTGAIVTT